MKFLASFNRIPTRHKWVTANRALGIDVGVKWTRKIEQKYLTKEYFIESSVLEHLDA